MILIYLNFLFNKIKKNNKNNKTTWILPKWRGNWMCLTLY